MLQTLQSIQLQAPWFFPLIVGVLGACIGSFLNVCIYRIPKGESVAHPPSHCGCGKPIAWYDNVPILSWFVLRGRARCCGARFSFRYPAIEILTAGVFLLCWFKAPPLVATCWMVFASLMIIATFVDLDTMTIPDRTSVGGMIVGVVLSGFVPALHATGAHHVPGNFAAIVYSIEGAFIGSALVYWIMVLAEIALGRPAMGEGDVKLMGAIGAFCGWQGTVFALFGGSVIGTVIYFAFMLAQLILGTRKKQEKAAAPAPAEPAPPSTAHEPAPQERQPEADIIAFDPEAAEDDTPEGAIPFGPALAAGALVYLFWYKPYMLNFFNGLYEVFMRR